MKSKPSKVSTLISLVVVFLPFTLVMADAARRARAHTPKPQRPRQMGRSAEAGIPRPAVLKETAVINPLVGTHAERALERIRFPWRDLGFQVSFMGRRPGFRALTLVEENRIEVYLKSEEGPDQVAFDLAHEFGHVVDLKYNDDERRRRWMVMRGIDPATPWFGESACSDFDTPAGDFAETFAYLLLGPGSYHSRMAPPPRPEQIRELAEFCRIQHVSSALLQ